VHRLLQPRDAHDPTLAGITTVADEASRWRDEIASSWARTGRPFERRLLDRTIERLDGLLADDAPTSLVHQDLHAGNVLAARNGGWLAIDPKPLVGDPALGLGAIIRGPELGLDRASVVARLDRLAAELGLDHDRVRDWTIVQTVAWSFDVPFGESMLEVVSWLEAA